MIDVGCADRQYGLALSWRKGPKEALVELSATRGADCARSRHLAWACRPHVIRHELSGSSASDIHLAPPSIEALAMVISGGGVSGGTYKSVSDGGLELIRV